jgi:hypothetical protein
MVFMGKIILREIAIWILSVAVLPVAVILYLIHTNSLSFGLVVISRDMFSGGSGLAASPLSLWVKLFSPYLLVQSVRAFFWSRRSLTGTKWANLYFALLLACVAGWSLWEAWDLFYLMYALGDIPGELVQFLRLEVYNLIVFVAAVFLTIHCFRTFLNPARNARRHA